MHTFVATLTRNEQLRRNETISVYLDMCGQRDVLKYWVSDCMFAISTTDQHDTFVATLTRNEQKTKRDHQRVP